MLNRLDRLLDRLDVEVEPRPGHDGRPHGVPGRVHDGTPTVHYTRHGCGALELTGGAIVRLSTQSVSVVPAHARARITENGHGRRAVGSLAGDPDVLTACVRIRATYQGSINLFDHLGAPLVEDLAADDPIRRSLEEFLEEIGALRPGCRAMAAGLLRRSLVLLLRRVYEYGDGRLSWLAALEDSPVWRAAAAMQDRPEHGFTLRELAEDAGMSRTVFAARFTDALGQAPIEFLKGRRLARAEELLSRTDLPVKMVAARIGYSSRSSFSRAFTASHGAAPAAFRIAAGAAPRARAS